VDHRLEKQESTLVASGSWAANRVGRRRERTMNAAELGKTGLVGWRERVATGIAGPVSERTGLSDEQVRALVGALFFALALYYVAGTLRRAMTTVRA
jgi:hypothetical protein